MRKQRIDWDEPGATEAIQKIAKELELTDLRQSPVDNRKWLGTLANGHTATLHVEPVSAHNARTYRGWVALHESEWARIKQPHPDMIHPYTVMFGRSPDDRWWWIQAFHEDRLRDLLPKVHRVRQDYWRLPPDVAKSAAATPVIDLLQTTIPWDEALCLHSVLLREEETGGYRCDVCGEQVHVEVTAPV